MAEERSVMNLSGSLVYAGIAHKKQIQMYLISAGVFMGMQNFRFIPMVCHGGVGLALFWSRSRLSLALGPVLSADTILS